MFQFCSLPKFVVVPGMLIVIELERAMKKRWPLNDIKVPSTNGTSSYVVVLLELNCD